MRSLSLTRAPSCPLLHVSSFCACSVIFDKIGIDKLLSLLKDCSEPVRHAAACLFSSLSHFPDQFVPLVDAPEVLARLVDVFLADNDPISIATLPAIARLSQDAKSVSMGKETMVKMVEMLNARADSVERDDQRTSTALLLCLRNATIRADGKELAIDVGVVESLSKFLTSRRPEVLLLATSALLGITVSVRGLQKAISTEGTVKDLCALALDASNARPLITNARAAIGNIVERADGLTACGEFLFHEPSALCEIVGPARMATLVSDRLEAPRHVLAAVQALAVLVRVPEGVHVRACAAYRLFHHTNLDRYC